MTEKEVLAISVGHVVRLHFVLALADGTVIEDTRSRAEPISWVVGSEDIPPQYAKHLMGLNAGDRRTVTIAADDAFGPHRMENVQQLPVSQFKDLELHEGLVVGFQQGQGGGEVPGIITAIEEPWITVDFNHPLAGREVSFSVEIFSIAPAGTEAVQL